MPPNQDVPVADERFARGFPSVPQNMRRFRLQNDGDELRLRIEYADPNMPRGWYAGPWNSDLPVSVGYANAGIDEPHLHTTLTEIYLVARGWSDVRIERQTVRLAAGDMLVVEPGEAHTFLGNSPGYLHFVLQVPGLSGAAAQNDKVAVPRSRLRPDEAEEL